MECKAVLATLVDECGLNLPPHPETEQSRYLKLSTSTIFEFQTDDVCRALTRQAGLGREGSSSHMASVRLRCDGIM